MVAGRAGERGDGAERAEALLSAGSHHLLLVPPGARSTSFSRALVCMAVGEPGKEDAAFSGRLLRHLGGAASLLTVLPDEERGEGSGERARADRFLAGNRRALERLGVPVEARVRFGDPLAEILEQVEEGDHDLVVLGTPLRGREGELALKGIAARLLRELADRPVLVVRSPEVAA